MMALLLLVGCGPGNTYDLDPLPAALGLSPSVSTLGPVAPGESAVATVQLDNIGGEAATLFYELIDDLGPGPELTIEPPFVLEVDESADVEFTFAPSAPGSAITWLHVTTEGDDPCNEAWAVIRSAAVDGSCGADADCDGVLAGDGDCDDDNPWVGPGFHEVCDGVDNDCDGAIDPSCKSTCGHPPR